MKYSASLTIVAMVCVGRAEPRGNQVPDGNPTADGPVCGSATYLRFNGSGTDGVWGTADDVISGRETWSFPGFVDLFSTRTIVWYTAPGPDTVWETDDDVVG